MNGAIGTEQEKKDEANDASRSDGLLARPGTSYIVLGTPLLQVQYGVRWAIMGPEDPNAAKNCNTIAACNFLKLSLVTGTDSNGHLLHPK